MRDKSDELAVRNGCYFDPLRGSWTVWWIERYCRLYEGEYAGEPLILRGCHDDAIDRWPIPSDFDAELMLERCEEYCRQVEVGRPCDWQYEGIMRLYGWQRPHGEGSRRRFRAGMFWQPKKQKKMLALDTPLPTPTGWTTMGEVKIGDKLFDECGRQCTVMDISDIDLAPESYAITFSNGEVVRACGDHLWVTRSLASEVSTVRGAVRVRRHASESRTTRDIRDTLLRGDGARNHSLQMPGPIECRDAVLPIDPYVLGVWLGDGDSDRATLTCSGDDLQHFQCELGRAGYVFRRIRRDAPPRTTYRVMFEVAQQSLFGDAVPNCGAFRAILKGMGVLNRKRIPKRYLRAAVEQRLALLQGLMDTGGCAVKSGTQHVFSSSNNELADGFCELLSSLGVKCRDRRVSTTCLGKRYASRRITFHAFRDTLPVYRMQRKVERMRWSGQTKSSPRSRSVQVVSVEPIPPTPMRCITVDSPSHQYLCGRTMIPTHNTPTAAANAIYLICGDSEPGNHVYIGARDGWQVKNNLMMHCMHMVEQSPELLQECKINHVECKITHMPSRSTISVLTSSDRRTKDAKEGINGSVLLDELHVVERDLVRIVRRAGISRREPLHIEISTAGNNPDSYGKQRFTLGEKIISGEVEEDSILCMIASAPQNTTDSQIDADPVKYGRLANPAWGHTIHEAEFLADYQQSRISEFDWPDFKRYRLNIWQSSVRRLISENQWDECCGDFTVDDLRNEWCIIGVDMSRKQDMTAAVALFPVYEQKGLVQMRQIARFWLPETYADEQQEVSFRKWAESGWLELTEGDEISVADVYRGIAEWHSLFDVRALYYDPYGAVELTQIIEQGLVDRSGKVVLDGLHIDRHPVPQGGPLMARAIEDYEKLVRTKVVQHDGNPIMAWQWGNADVKDMGHRFKIQKPQRNSAKKVDGAVASVIANAGVMELSHELTFTSFYEDNTLELI